MNLEEAVSFLERVWAIQCEPGDFVCVAAKGNSWVDKAFPYDDALRGKLETWLTANATKSMYFCPLPFTQPRRKKELVARSRLLWSDLDFASHEKCPPSILWESSPGRHQGLWLTGKTLEPDIAAQQSRSLAYYLGADKGGWDLTQVLRIPGTPNTKYPERPLVKLVRFTDKILRKIPQSTLERWRATIPRKLLRIIEGPAEQGKRSDMLWYLEHELCDIGIPLKDAVGILRDTEWNKYRGRADEEERFQAEIDKIKEDRGEKKVETRLESRELRIVDYGQMLASQAGNPGWMVRDFWMRGSHGIVAGEPKSFKSTLVLDLLTSVAADKPFLGEFPVEFGGPVLIVQNENADWIMKDRLEKMASSKGEVGRIRTQGRKLQIEWPRKLPMIFINQQGIMVDDAADKEALEDLISRMRPAAITLDPLYLMFNGDVNSAKDLNGVLQWLLYIKQEYDCSVILVHHYGKGKEGVRGGQRMLGSTTLHGWIESAWYLQVQDPEDKKAIITLEREFRGAGIYGKLDVEISMGEHGDPRYDTSVSEHKEDRAADSPGGEQDIVDVLSQSTDLMAKTALAKKTGMSRYLIDKLVEKLQKDGAIYRKGERYGVNKRKEQEE